MRADADSNRGPSAYQPNALPLGQTGSQFFKLCMFYILPNIRQKKAFFDVDII